MFHVRDVSILSLAGEPNHQPFQDHAGGERGISLDIEVGLEQEPGKLVDARWAQVGVLLAHLGHGPGVDSGFLAGLLQIEAGPAQLAGVVDLQERERHPRQEPDRGLARTQEPVEVGQGLGRLARGGRLDGPPERLDPPRANHLRHVVAVNRVLFADIDVKLLDLGGQETDLRPDQLDQEVRGVVVELDLEPAPGELDQPAG
jgi:hypothetical protein